MGTITETEASRILRAVPFSQGFHFNKEDGEYTNSTAVSLADFVEKLHKTTIESIIFHFPRGDFQKWISNILGDKELADRISKISQRLSPEELRKQLTRVAKKRLLELSRISRHRQASLFVEE